MELSVGGIDIKPRPRRTECIRLLILAEVRFYREGLALFFGGRPGFEVTATSEDARAVAATIRSGAFDVVLLDLPMRACTDAARLLSTAAPATGLVAIGLQEDEAEVIAMAEAGVSGFVSRDASLEELALSVKSAATGETRCSPRIAAILARRVAMLARVTVDAGPDIPLTARQLEIVRLISEGLPNKVIAQRLFIEVPTVKNHVHNILERLGVERREEAVAAVRTRSGGRFA